MILHLLIQLLPQVHLITMSVIQSGCKHPERCVIGHPFNPPHMIPLVEVVGGNKTSYGSYPTSDLFLCVYWKKTDLSTKEFPGHAANRLQMRSL